MLAYMRCNSKYFVCTDLDAVQEKLYLDIAICYTHHCPATKMSVYIDQPWLKGFCSAACITVSEGIKTSLIMYKIEMAFEMATISKQAIREEDR